MWLCVRHESGLIVTRYSTRVLEKRHPIHGPIVDKVKFVQERSHMLAIRIRRIRIGTNHVLAHFSTHCSFATELPCRSRETAICGAIYEKSRGRVGPRRGRCACCYCRYGRYFSGSMLLLLWRHWMLLLLHIRCFFTAVARMERRFLRFVTGLFWIAWLVIFFILIHEILFTCVCVCVCVRFYIICAIYIIVY
jgi:hypothetical protein